MNEYEIIIKLINLKPKKLILFIVNKLIFENKK